LHERKGKKQKKKKKGGKKGGGDGSTLRVQKDEGKKTVSLGKIKSATARRKKGKSLNQEKGCPKKKKTGPFESSTRKGKGKGKENYRRGEKTARHRG